MQYIDAISDQTCCNGESPDPIVVSRSRPWWVLHGAGLCSSSIRIGLSHRCITGLVSQSCGLLTRLVVVSLCLAAHHSLH